MVAIPSMPLSALTFDAGLQLRADGTDEALVEEYRETLERGDHFPPLRAKYDGTTYWVYSGFHRGEAARRQGVNDVSVMVEPGGFDDALLAACGENAEHGKRRRRGDVAVAVRALLPVIARRIDFPDGWTQKRIAQTCRTSPTHISHLFHAWREDSEVGNYVVQFLAPAISQGMERRTADADRAEDERRQAEADAARQAELDAIREATLAQARDDFNALAAEREAWLRDQINLMRQEARDANAQALALRAELTQLQDAERRRTEAVAADLADAAQLADDMFEKNPELVRARWRAALSQAESMVHRHWLMLNVDAFATVADESERRRMIDFLAKLRASIDRAEHALGVKVMSQGGRRHGKANTAN